MRELNLLHLIFIRAGNLELSIGNYGLNYFSKETLQRDGIPLIDGFLTDLSLILFKCPNIYQHFPTRLKKSIKLLKGFDTPLH